MTCRHVPVMCRWGSPSRLDYYVSSTFDQRSANEKEGDLPQARAITCGQVSSKTLQLKTIMKKAVWLRLHDAVILISNVRIPGFEYQLQWI